MSRLTRFDQNTSVPRIPVHRISLRQIWPQKNPPDHHDRQYTLCPSVRELHTFASGIRHETDPACPYKAG